MAKAQTTRFNELEYEFEIILDNGAGASDTSRFIINPNAIVNLVIEETLADWVTRGYITLYYAFDAIENTSKVKTTTIDGSTVPNYIFRNDGNDNLYIRLFPNLKPTGLEVDPLHWELLYKFSIYDVEDITLPESEDKATSANMKCKKFYFWDSWYQKMITNTMEYSTAQTAQVASLAPLDSDRSVPTGIAIKDIITKALGDIDNDIPYILSLAGGPNNLWDEGKSNIFYTAPAYNNAYETLIDVYNRHVSSKFINSSKIRSASIGPRGASAKGNTVNDFAILTKERGPQRGDYGYFTLQPMSNYFEKAGKSAPGEYQIERFLVQDLGGGTGVKIKRSPESTTQSLQKDFKLNQYSQISSYTFVDISPLTNATNFANRAIYSFDFKNRIYNVEFNNNTAKAAREFISKRYINNVLTNSTSNLEKLFLITLDTNKQTRNVKPIFDNYGGNDSNDFIVRQANGIQKILKVGVFQNTCIHFRTLGSTNRRPGRFIAIDKEVPVDDNSFNNRLYGQWFVINVKHIIENGIYYNEIAAVKLHRYKTLPQNHVATI
jgi:hypothetical protein